MKFSSIVTFFLAPLALAAPLLEERQNANAVIASISTIQKNLVALNNTLNGFKPNDKLGLVKALQIQSQVTKLGDSIDAATNATNASPPFGDDDSANVAIALLDLQPQIASLLNNIVAKKPAFATAVFGFGDLSKTVRANLVAQKASTNKLGQAVTAKLASPYSDIAPSVLAEILGYFDTAIAAYDKCTGKVCLPPISFPTKKFALPTKAKSS